MAYVDDLDLTNPNIPKYGGTLAPGVYDTYAIKYGYTKLEGARGRKLFLLANGQSERDENKKMVSKIHCLPR